MSWAFDAPTGTYKNHALSADIRMSAIANSQFMPWVDTEQGFGRKKGESITITRVGDLPLAARVTEHQLLPEGRPLIDTVPITVAEWGYKLPLTQKEQVLTHFDLRNRLQATLRNQLRLTMDKAAADAFKQTLIKAVTTSATPGASTVITTNGVPSGAALQNLRVQDLRDFRDYLHGDLKTPMFADGTYGGIISVKAARGIKADAEYKDWLSPTTRRPFITGELEREVEGFRLVVSNHFDALNNALNGGVAGEGLFFGPDVTAMVSALDPELRIGLTRDLGRFQDIGWVGLFEIGNVWPEGTPGYGRCIHYTST